MTTETCQRYTRRPNPPKDHERRADAGFRWLDARWHYCGSSRHGHLWERRQVSVETDEVAA